jgi:hypothetical protein
VHGVDTTELLDAELFPTDATDAELCRRIDFWFADLADLATPWPLPIPLTTVAERALAALPDTLPPPVALHSNPGRTHTFTDPATGRLTGLIDFGDAYLSHPAMDLRSWPDPADRQLLHDAYCDGQARDPVFDQIWTVAMVYADAAAIANRTPYADAAAADLIRRLDQL